jgi:hypothetical protein
MAAVDDRACTRSPCSSKRRNSVAPLYLENLLERMSAKNCNFATPGRPTNARTHSQMTRFSFAKLFVPFGGSVRLN